MPPVHVRVFFLYSVIGGLLSWATAAEPVQTWTDNGGGFTAGTLGHAGSNLYVNRYGALETIRRFDLDGNGWLDLLFNSTHDTFSALPATLATVAGSILAQTDLALDGSSRVVPGDLNRDGMTDLVIMPNRQNVQSDRNSVIIAWGDDDGWSAARVTRQLPVNGITGLAVGDLNADGWPDILTLNSKGWLFGQPDGRILRVYWGSPDGYLLSRYQDLGIPDALAVAAGHFGSSREFSAAVLTETGIIHFLTPGSDRACLQLAHSLQLPFDRDESSLIKPQCLLSQASGDSTADTLWVGTNASLLLQISMAGPRYEVESIEAAPATDLALGHLDDDPWPELVLTNRKLVFPSDPTALNQPASITILWGDAHGVTTIGSAALAIPNAVATAIGDLNVDGHRDLAVSVYQGNQSTLAASLVFLGDGSRKLPAIGLPVLTEGAEHVAITQLTSQTQPVAFFANSLRSTLDDAVPLRLYWGSTDGFSTKAMTDIPNLGGYKSSAADLNSDGYVDLVVINAGDVSDATAARAPQAGVIVYWGGAEGSIHGPGPVRFDPKRVLILHERHIGSINVADFNHDGFLDLVLGSFESPDALETDLIIYYGDATGLQQENRKTVRVPGRSIGCVIADINRDEYLDIIVGSYGTNQVITYWGAANGFSESHKTILPYPAPIDLEVADLNHDGWLDLIVASYEDGVAHHHDTGLTIFWGRVAGWGQSDAQWLPGMTPLGLAVADLDGDGFLDLVSPHYHGELSRENLPSYIYWGSARGYAPLHRTTLIVNSASEVVIADFDRDGKLDLAFTAHSVDAGHKCDCPIFFNDGQRFLSPKVQYLPAVGPHYTWVQDIGNIYDRSYEENFTSRIFTWLEPRLTGHLAIDAATPFGAKLRVHMRSAADQATLVSSPWREVAPGEFEVSASDRVLQYRLDLLSANGDAYPQVKKVDLLLQ